MHRWTLHADHSESGRASLEFLVFGVTLLIPVMFLGMSLASIQGATLAAQGASDQAARVFIQQPGLAEASSRAETAAVVALRNHGVDSVARLERFCEPSPCLSPGSAVTIRVSVEAPLFTSSVLPGVLGAETMTVSAESTRIVSRYGVPR
ncbi:MAG: hypothetical protein RIE23_05260 [Pontimonas sp.]